MGDDYDGLWFFLKYENYGKEPLIIIIVHQKINQIIVQKMSELWLQGMTMVDYDFFSLEYHDGFLKIAIIVHHEIIKNWTMIMGDDYDRLWWKVVNPDFKY
jgi:hypothetical protein